MRVTVTPEKLKKRSGPGRCFNCQKVGHMARDCDMPMRCVRCGEKHKYEECPVPQGEGKEKCCNCAGAHPASYLGCPEFRKARDRLRGKHPQTAGAKHRTAPPPPPPSRYPRSTATRPVRLSPSVSVRERVWPSMYGPKERDEVNMLWTRLLARGNGAFPHTGAVRLADGIYSLSPGRCRQLEKLLEGRNSQVASSPPQGRFFRNPPNYRHVAFPRTV
ncbi:uncharacterized protein LOC124616321 [Schistocerca americana]|uniref:uncharacterized protein LOC124616321 n=1 Tax=Schistocerca americana TaxID=7009 RepID=UPI001F4F1711|nr:uncharacterized protein LOC124616321 [Schistocerca americana]